MEPITKAKIELRIGLPQLMNPTRVQEMVAYLQKHPGMVDEVALFTGLTHSAFPLSLILERCEVIARVLPQFKAIGLIAGINHMTTIGHSEENLDHSLNEPWQHLVDISGAVSRSCYCGSDPLVQEYIRQSYIALAKTGPDFIWFDDDLRLDSHLPIKYPCFCDLCMAKFSREAGRTWTRETLWEAFRSGTLEERLALRRQWLEHNRQWIADLLSVMRSAVDTVTPHLTLGFETVEGAYSAYGNAEWTAVLAGSKNLPVMYRAGGGFYSDRTPLDSIMKANWTGRQVAFIPDSVSDIQYEHENFPYQVLKKSTTMFLDEIGMAIAVGCTGVMLSLDFMTDNPFEEFYPYLEAMYASQKFFNQAAATFGRRKNLGFWTGFTRDQAAAINPRDDWFKSYLYNADFLKFNELTETGLPMTYSPEGAALTLLNGTSVLSLPREALMKALSAGVLMDGSALSELEAIGLGEYTGFKVLGTRELNTIEQFTHDTLNGRFGGYKRDCRPAFNPELTYLLEPLPGARLLSEVFDFNKTNLGVSSGVFENSLGGRIAVMGYFPWNLIQSLPKSSQLKALFRWLSRDTFPAFINSYSSAALWLRPDTQGRLAMMLLNSSLDPSASMDLLALTGGINLTVMHMDGSEQALSSAGKDGPYDHYSVPALKAWEMVLITAA
jgi:hypothetical protein